MVWTGDKVLGLDFFLNVYLDSLISLQQNQLLIVAPPHLQRPPIGIVVAQILLQQWLVLKMLIAQSLLQTSSPFCYYQDFKCSRNIEQLL